MSSRHLFAALAIVLAIVVVADAARSFPTQAGIDFYHLWGVPMGQRASAQPLSPYAETVRYAQLLNVLADNSTSEALRTANRFKREIAPTGTPLFYATFAFLPDDYGTAHLLFAALQYIAGATAIFLLARLRGVAPWPSACIALAIELTFNPFVQDVKWGNATAFQLLFIAACLYGAVHAMFARRPWADRLFLPALALFVLFKPNTLWIAAALALHYAAIRGARNTLIGAAAALPAGLLAWSASAAYFGNAAIWNEWLAYARGGSLAYRFEEGNQSWPMLLAQIAPAHGAWGYGLLVSAFAIVVLAAVLLRDRNTADLVPRARAVFSDPWAAVSTGVLFTLASSPLVWPYYHLFALLPIFWLVRTHGRWDGPSWCAVATYAALSSPVLALLIAAEQLAALRLLMFLSWLPLVPAVLSRLAPLARAQAARAPAQATR